MDQVLQKELTVQLHDNPESDEVLKAPTIADTPALAGIVSFLAHVNYSSGITFISFYIYASAERRRLQGEKSTDAQALQRFKNYMQNKRNR